MKTTKGSTGKGGVGIRAADLPDDSGQVIHLSAWFSFCDKYKKDIDSPFHR